MRISVWVDGSAPVFLNPTAAETIELAEARVDTLRICEEDGRLAVASGYGNTHTSIRAVAVKHWPRYFPHEHILFRRDGAWWWNLDCADKYYRLESGCRHVFPITAAFVREFAALEGQQ